MPHDDVIPEIVSAAPGRRASGLVSWTVRMAVAAALVSVAAIQFLAGVAVPGSSTAPRLAWTSAGLSDPETTGAISPSRLPRLDPCTTALRGSQ